MKRQQHPTGQWFTIEVAVDETTRSYGIWAQSREEAQAQAALLAVQESVREVMWQGIDQYRACTEERRIPAMESMVLNLATGRVILYGKNIFEGPIIEYHGPHGDWQCAMTATLKLKGEPYRQQKGAGA